MPWIRGAIRAMDPHLTMTVVKNLRASSFHGSVKYHGYIEGLSGSVPFGPWHLLNDFPPRARLASKRIGFDFIPTGYPLNPRLFCQLASSSAIQMECGGACQSCLPRRFERFAGIIFGLHHTKGRHRTRPEICVISEVQRCVNLHRGSQNDCPLKPRP